AVTEAVDADDEELDELLGVLDVFELEEELPQAAVTRTAPMNRMHARFMGSPTAGARPGIASSRETLSGRGRRATGRGRHHAEADEHDPAPLSPRPAGRGPPPRPH